MLSGLIKKILIVLSYEPEIKYFESGVKVSFQIPSIFYFFIIMKEKINFVYFLSISN